MKKGLIIFGTGKIADVVQYFVEEDNPGRLVGFTVDAEHKSADEKSGLPVVPFEDIESFYPPNDYDLFVAVGYHQMNQVRREKVKQAREKGYNLPSIVSSRSGVPSDLTYGDNCFIMSQVNIHPNVRMGNNVFAWSGAMIGHHSQIGDNVWITSTANIGGNVTVGQGCFLALNSTISHSVSVGEQAFIGSNALVTRNLEDKQVVMAENHKPIRLNSDQFLRMSNFGNL